MNALPELGTEPLSQRRLYALSLAAPEALPRSITLPTEHFACLLAWDARGVTEIQVSDVARSLIASGASYFVCWGPDCQRVHDIIDKVANEKESPVPHDSCIMTTSHDDEPLEEAIWFFLVCTSPESHYEEKTGSSLAVSIGSLEWERTISEALRNVREFESRIGDVGVA